MTLRIAVALGLVASLVLGFGAIDLMVAVAPGPEWVPLRMLEAGWGVVFGLVVPIALIAQVRRGGGPVAALQQLVVVAASLAIAALLTLKAREWPLVLAVAVLALVVAAVHPARSRLLLRSRAPDRRLAGLAALAVVPAGIYAAQMAENRRAGLAGDTTLGFEHWTVQSAVPVCLVLLVALSSLRTEGWRVPAASAVVGTVVLSGIAIAAGDVSGGFATGWAIAAIAWSALVAAAVARATA